MKARIEKKLSKNIYAMVAHADQNVLWRYFPHEVVQDREMPLSFSPSHGTTTLYAALKKEYADIISLQGSVFIAVKGRRCTLSDTQRLNGRRVLAVVRYTIEFAEQHYYEMHMFDDLVVDATQEISYATKAVSDWMSLLTPSQ